MIINVTNTAGVAVAIPTVKGAFFNLQAGATQNNLTVDDARRNDVDALRTSGMITLTYVQLPNISAAGVITKGRTEVPGAAYTLLATDAGCVIESTGSSACVITLPATAARGFSCDVLPYGSGGVTWAAASGSTIRTPGAQTGARVQYSMFTVWVRDNVGGAAAEWVVSGDIA